MSFIDVFKREMGKGDIVNDVTRAFDTTVDFTRTMQERIWWRNLLYYCGEQWLEWFRGASTFRRRQALNPSAAPVCNEVRGFVRAVKSMLLNQNLLPKVSASSNKLVDKAAAELGEGLLVWMDSLNEDEIEDEKEKMVVCMALFGVGFMRTIPDMTLGRWFLDKNGNQAATGDVVSENVIGFNVRVSDEGDTLRKKTWIGLQTLRNKEWVSDTFHILAKELTSDPVLSVDYQRKLMTLVGQVSLWKGQGVSYTTEETTLSKLIMLREVEFRPTIQYPDGRYIVVCGGKVLVDAKRLPIIKDSDQWFYSLVDFHYNYVPGKFWSDSGVDDIISPQNIINEIDKSLADNRKQLGRTTVLVPTELSMKRMSDHGDQVLVLSYDGHTTGGARPLFQQGIPLPNQVIEERELQQKNIQDRSGDPKNVLKGQAPSAHASGVMTDILRETAQEGYQPDVKRYNRGMKRVYKLRLLVAKEVYTEKKMIKVTGPGSKEKVVPFKSSALRDNTDVRMELDSGLATTKAGQRGVLMDLLQAGIFAQQMQDPSMRQDILKRFGFSGFTDPTNVDLDRAERENSMVAAEDIEELHTVTTPVGPESQVRVDDPFFKYDNHAIHFETHRRFMLTPEFKELPTPIQAAMVVHTDVHNLLNQAAQKAQMEQMAQMQAMSKGGGGGESGTPTPPTGERQGGPTQ